MRFQSDNFDCGPGTVANIAAGFGISLSYRRIIKACKTTREDGTDELGMLEGLRACRLTVSQFETNSTTVAWRWLHGSLLAGCLVALCVDSWSHWVCCVGLLGSEKIILIDSSNSKRNKKVNGVHLLDKLSLMRRWKNARIPREQGKRMYAISARRPV